MLRKKHTHDWEIISWEEFEKLLGGKITVNAHPLRAVPSVCTTCGLVDLSLKPKGWWEK